MRRYLIAGLLVWVPIVITIWVLAFLINTLDQVLLLLPENYRPDRVLGFHVPGLGAVLTFAILLVTGAIAANFFGARLIAMWEGLLGRIPFVKSIYHSVKQVSDTLLSESSNAFRKVLLVEFPHRDSWSIAVLTGSPSAPIASLLEGEHVTVYVPTTPNPTSGYVVLVPRSRVREVDMTVDEALKYIISMGVVAPKPHTEPADNKHPAREAVPVSALDHRN